MQAIFSKIDEPTIKEEYIEEAPQEDIPEEDIPVEIPFIENADGEEAQDNDTFENIFKNRNKRILYGALAPNQENIPPDFSTDKPFYHGYYEKNDGEGVGWGTEMIMFYKNSWGGENFTVNDCISKMDRKFSLHFSRMFLKNYLFSQRVLENISFRSVSQIQKEVEY